MQLYKNKEDCYGCGACANICPKLAITMKEDDKGFLYPKINSSLCIKCGLCKQVCQISKEKRFTEEVTEKCYGIKNNDEIRKSSSSGGIYTALSDVILDEGGVCVGVAYDKTMKVVHQIGKNSIERNAFRGSKYVQSDTLQTFQQTAQFLKEGKKVLFVGTPCQINGLKIFVMTKRIDCSKLFCVDMVCHGTPSPRVWKEYILFLEEKYNSKVISYDFRNKENGWHGYHVSVGFENNNVVGENDITQSFVKLFSRNIMLRSSCYKCPYTSFNRTGDITIGDFWGIEKIDSEFADNKGVSMVLINTKKGMQLFSQILQCEEIKGRIYKTEQIQQPQLYRPTFKGWFYKDFWRCFQKKGYMCVAKKYGGYGTNQLFYHIRDSIMYRISQIADKEK